MPMMNYSETYPFSSLIQTDLNSGKMPPWPPDTTYSRFMHERIITTPEKNAILSWIASGSQMGDTTIANGCPPAPTYMQYNLNGTPDLILKIPTFTSNASSNNAYNCFSLPTGLTQDRIIRAFEVVPGNPAIVHHVVVKVDSTGTVSSNTSGGCFTEPGDYDLDVWAPGGAPTVFPSSPQLKMGIKIKSGANVVMQIHYPPGTAGQIDSTQIRIYFYPIGTPGIRNVSVATKLQNWSMFIFANTTPTYNATWSSGDISLFGTFPHSHLLCTTMTNWADNGTTTIPIIKINKWDFNWQGFYFFNKMLHIPSGYTVRGAHVYDNTTNNPNNPNNPPQFVQAGTGTTDEMLFDSFQWLPYQAGDENIDIGSILAGDSLLSTSVNENASVNIYSYAFPNPFSDNVKIGYELANSATTSISVYNIFGSEVKNLVSQFNATAGNYSVNWDGRNNFGAKVSSGVYFYTIRAGKSETSGKIVLMPK